MASAEQPGTAPRRTLWTAVGDEFAAWGALVLGTVETIGDIALFTWNTCVWLFSRLPRRETLLPNFYQVGVRSLPVVALTGTFPARGPRSSRQ